MLNRGQKRVFALAMAGFGSMLASSNCWAVDNQFNASIGTDFNTAGNWTPNSLPGSNTVDNYFVQSGLTSVYSGGTILVHGLVVSDDSPGTLNMTAGDLTVTGGVFEVARGHNSIQPNAGGLMDLSGTSILRTGATSGDNAAVGDRDKGVLHIGPNASVLSPFTYWRVGNFGPTVDAGLSGNGLIDVEGTFHTRALFVGVQDGTGVVQVRGHGSVVLTAQADDPLTADINMNFNHDPIAQPNQNGTIHMIGSTATLSARDLFSQEAATVPVKNKLWFTADSGGVSDILLSNAINITNNALVVDLAGFTVAPGKSILLVDAAPNQITGTFTNISVTGTAFGSQVLYDQSTGNISLLIVPEPATITALAIGATLLIRRRRQQSAGD